MATFEFKGPKDLHAAVGKHLGYSHWIPVTQERINAYADASGERQWIHVDLERAKNGPFGKTIAHGALMICYTDPEEPLLKFEGFNRGMNYGYDKIRFPNIVPVDSRVRTGVKVVKCEDVPNGVQTTFEMTVEIEGQERPACVYQQIFRHVF